MKQIKKIRLSGADVYPIVEGGKGVGVSNGHTAGAFAAAGAVGTFSAVYPNLLHELAEERSINQRKMSRQERSEYLSVEGIKESIVQAKIAHEVSNGNGRIHLNILWGLAGAERMLDGILGATKGMVHGITCGAGMPYRLADLARKYQVYFYPIISSMRAFSILWLRTYSHASELLGGVVYEDPWRAGGHNGITNKEDPEVPEDSYPRVVELRRFMKNVGLGNVPIVMAGGVWNLSEYDGWLDNPEVGPIAFQFGTRPLLTKESPISDAWKNKLMQLKPGDIWLNKFSPTNFYSSAIINGFLAELTERSLRQIEFKDSAEGDYTELVPVGFGGLNVYVKPADKSRAAAWMEEGFEIGLATPDSTLLFVTKEKARNIQKDQSECSGCLAACRFSSWLDSPAHRFVTGISPDPRSYCILKTLQHAIQGINIEENLLFAGSNAYRFADDPLYSGGHVPTVGEFVNCLLQGE
jgi:NAD(P)H-dependent flavin oxidoreductase YrpB (nitropropane dioxygenase family)